MARLLCQDIIKTCLFLAAIGVLERVGHATFEGAKENIQKSELVVFYEIQQQFAVFVEHVSAIYVHALLSVSPPPSPLFPVVAFAYVKMKTYYRAGIDATMLEDCHVFCPLPLRRFLSRGAGHHESKEMLFNLKSSLQAMCADALDCDAVLASLFNDILSYRQSNPMLPFSAFDSAAITAEIDAVSRCHNFGSSVPFGVLQSNNATTLISTGHSRGSMWPIPSTPLTAALRTLNVPNMSSSS